MSHTGIEGGIKQRPQECASQSGVMRFVPGRFVLGAVLDTIPGKVPCILSYRTAVCARLTYIHTYSTLRYV